MFYCCSTDKPASSATLLTKHVIIFFCCIVSPSQMLASDTDFGGYTGPIICLVLIGAFILSLNPPLEGSDNKSKM